MEGGWGCEEEEDNNCSKLKLSACRHARDIPVNNFCYKYNRLTRVVERYYSFFMYSLGEPAGRGRNGLQT